MYSPTYQLLTSGIEGTCMQKPLPTVTDPNTGAVSTLPSPDDTLYCGATSPPCSMSCDGTFL